MRKREGIPHKTPWWQRLSENFPSVVWVTPHVARHDFNETTRKWTQPQTPSAVFPDLLRDEVVLVHRARPEADGLAGHGGALDRDGVEVLLVDVPSPVTCFFEGRRVSQTLDGVSKTRFDST